MILFVLVKPKFGEKKWAIQGLKGPSKNVVMLMVSQAEVLYPANVIVFTCIYLHVQTRFMNEVSM